MDTDVNYTLVGAFVIGLFAVLILGIIWLSSGFTIQTYSTYKIYMQESVSGLNVNAPVEYNGVNVGTVTSITLNRSNPHLVELLLQIKTDTPVTEGTTATLDTKGITGIAFVALKDIGNQLTPLKAENGETYPVIKTTPSLFLRLDTALSKLTSSLSNVSNSIQSVLDEDNLRSIKHTLSHLDTVTGALAANTQQLINILNNTSKASQQFGPTMQILNTQTLPSTNSAISHLNGVTRDLSDNPSMLIRGTSPQPLGPGEQ